MGPLGAVIIIILGIFLPFVTIVAMPFRLIYLLSKGDKFVKIISLLLLIFWGVCVWLIAKHGYVSQSERGTGPTVSPQLWMVVGLIWYFAESRHKKNTINHDDEKL